MLSDPATFDSEIMALSFFLQGKRRELYLKCLSKGRGPREQVVPPVCLQFDLDTG
jgi:hypothetical protein